MGIGVGDGGVKGDGGGGGWWEGELGFGGLGGLGVRDRGWVKKE